MGTYTRLVTLLLVLLTSLIPARGLAESPSDWESLRKEREGLADSASQTATDEQTAVAELFALNRTLEELRGAIAKLDKEITEVTLQQAAAQQERDRLETRLRERQELFGRRVRYYAENGTFAPVGFLLESSTFSDFLFRIDFLTMILEQDARLSQELRDLTAQVKEQELKLAARREELTALRTKQAAEEEKLNQEITRKEAFLAGLREQRSAVEAKAAQLEEVWVSAARPVLEAFGKSLQSVALKVGDITPDAVKFSLVPPGATVTVKEESLNAFLAREGDLLGLTFDLIPGQANLQGEFGGVNMRISGRFLLKSKTEVRYEPLEVRFHGVTLPRRLTDDLLAAGRLDMDFANLVGVWTVKEIRVEDGAMVVSAGLR